MISDDLEKLANRVIGAALEVHSILGPGYIEGIYEEALAREFILRCIPFDRQKMIKLNYKGYSVGEGRVDFLVGNQLIVELKAVEHFSAIHTAQVISYLKITNLQLGLLLNFNVPSLSSGIKRVVLTKKTNHGYPLRT